MRYYLKKLRLDNSATQMELAEALGIGQGYYSDIENGTKLKVIDLILLDKIAKYYGVTLQSLVEEELKIIKESKGA